MTSPVTTPLTVAGTATPEFYVDATDQASCFVDAPAFVGYAVIERKVGSSAWEFVREVADQANTPINGRNYYRVRLVYLVSGSLTVTFSALDNTDHSPDILADARSYTDTAVASAAATAASAVALAQQASPGFDPFLVSHFDTDGNLDGWTAGNVTATVAGGGFSFTSIGGGSAPTRTAPGGTSFKGRDYYIIKIGITRTAGDPNTGWAGNAQFSTSTRGTLVNTNCKTLANPILALGVPQVLTWDMRSVTSTIAASEWTDSDIVDLRLQLVNAAGHSFKIDWIAIGRPAPVNKASSGVSQAYADAGDASALAAAKTYTDQQVVAGSSGNFTFGGTGAATRTMNAKVKEIECSVLDFGADPTGATFSTTAFANAIASGSPNIHVPAGTYKVLNINLNKQVRLFGDGRHCTNVNITTTTDHGIVAMGDPALDGSQVLVLEDINFEYTGTGQAAHKHGLYYGVRVYVRGCWFQDFTGTGIFGTSYLNEVSDPTYVDHLPFFARFDDTWVWGCHEDGMQIRLGCNATQVINCNFLRNLRYGLYHHDGNDGTGGQGGTASSPPTYGCVIIGGEASYSKFEGYRLESGVQLTLLGTYAEGNGLSGGSGYINTQYDYYVGDTLNNSLIQPGVVQATGGSMAPRVRVPANNFTTTVACGGNRFTPMCAAVAQLAGGATLAQTVAKVNELLTELTTRKILKT